MPSKWMQKIFIKNVLVHVIAANVGVQEQMITSPNLISNSILHILLKEHLALWGPHSGGNVVMDILYLVFELLYSFGHFLQYLNYRILVCSYFPKTKNLSCTLLQCWSPQLQNFFPKCLDMIKSEHLQTTRYKCNNCRLYLYYQAVCLLLDR